MKFSERIGAVRRVLQKDSMDEALRNALWNVAYLTFWDDLSRGERLKDLYSAGPLLRALWIGHFSLAADTIADFSESAVEQIKKLYMSASWSEVYDFVEFIANASPVESKSGKFIKRCNVALEKHISAYRFVGKTLAPITSEEEIAAQWNRRPAWLDNSVRSPNISEPQWPALGTAILPTTAIRSRNPSARLSQRARSSQVNRPQLH